MRERGVKFELVGPRSHLPRGDIKEPSWTRSQDVPENDTVTVICWIRCIGRLSLQLVLNFITTPVVIYRVITASPL
jgi:hypothetical protein